MDQSRWEIGSLFHLAAFPPGGEAPFWSEHEHRLFGSGRDALRVLLEHLRPERLWIPSYFCQEVVDALACTETNLTIFFDTPLAPGPRWQDVALRRGDAVLSVNFFGLRSEAHMVRPQVEGVLVIEDHTHDPCSEVAIRSHADYCIASLRKLWPLPDGGVLWSPRGHQLPATPELRPELEHASGVKLAGMALKALYLRDHNVSKEVCRSLLSAGEESLFGATPSGISRWSAELLGVLPLARFALARRVNWLALQQAVQRRPDRRLLVPRDANATPFAGILHFDVPEHAEQAHATMIKAQVYASKLWPLDQPRLPGVPESDQTLARCLLSLPIDMRYGAADMTKAAGIINMLP